jgi:hypothetical protein
MLLRTCSPLLRPVCWAALGLGLALVAAGDSWARPRGSHHVSDAEVVRQADRLDLPDPARSNARASWTRVHPEGTSPCDSADTAGSPSGQSIDHVWCFEGAGGDSTWPDNPGFGDSHNWDHWSRFDPPEGQDSPWHVTDFYPGPSTGTYNAWAGCDTSGATAGCADAHYWVLANGYGNQWNYPLVLDCSALDASVGGTIEFDLRYDAECSADYLFLEYLDEVSGAWEVVIDSVGGEAVFNAVSGVYDVAHGGTGRSCGTDYFGSSDQVVSEGDAHGNSSWLTGATFPVPQGFSGLMLRWRAQSDRTISDEDGGIDTDGLAAIDNVSITFDATGDIVSDDFESGTFNVSSTGPPAYWIQSGHAGDPYDGWHLEFDPNYKNKGNTTYFSDDWMWSSTPAVGAIPANGFAFILVAPRLDVSGWTEGVVEYSEYYCFLAPRIDYGQQVVRVHDSTIGAWSPWIDVGDSLSGGCTEWEMNKRVELTPYVGGTVDSLQVGWEVFDGSQPGDLAWGKHGAVKYLIDNVSFADYVPTGPVPQPEIQHPIELGQVSWNMDATGVVDHSEYGHLRFDFTPATTRLHFLNIVAEMDGPLTWLVQNMPLVTTEIIEMSLSETCQTVDLSGLGVVRGTSSAGDSVWYTVTLDTIPEETQPAFFPQYVVVLDSTRYSYGGDVYAGVPPVPGLDSPKGPAKPPWDGNTNLKWSWRVGMPNGEQGTNQCGPAAITNSMHWLEAQFPGQVFLGQTWNETLLKLKDYTNWDAGGIGQRDAIEGKLRMAADPGKIFFPDLNVKYEADATLTDLGASVTVAGRTARRHGPSGPPSFDWMMSELQDYEDVELSIDWLDNAGNKRGGHVVSVVGALQFGNKRFVWTNDDGDQGEKTGDPPVPPLNGGLRTNMLHQVTIENGGYMRLSGFRSNNRVKATYSESVEDIKTGMPDGTEGPQAAGLALDARPNPFSGSTTLRFHLPHAANVTVEIYGVDGRRLRTLHLGAADAGWNQAEWNGRDRAGNAVASGVYFARMKTGDRVIVKKLVLLREN